MTTTFPPPAADTFVPSAYQEAFFEELQNGTGHILLTAVAGSGKTLAIEKGTARLPYHVRSRTLCCAFNKHIELELQKRQRDGKIPTEVRIQTIHSLGKSILNRAFRPQDWQHWIDKNKYRHLVDYYLKHTSLPELEKADLTLDLEFGQAVIARMEAEAAPKRDEVATAIESMARLAMLTLTSEDDQDDLRSMAAHYRVEIPDGFEEAVLDAVPVVLQWGREGLPERDEDGLTYHPRERISFDDMVYLPNALDLSAPTFLYVFADEAQDLNAAQRELVLRAVAPCVGRFIAVGDPRQAIYGFSGADAESFETIARKTDAKRMMLSICYRCAPAIVKRAQSLCPEIEANPNPKRDQVKGVVLEVPEEALLALAEDHYKNEHTRKDTFLILCRTNAPLVKAAFDLIRRAVPAKVKGRDIGASLVKTLDEIARMQGFDFAHFGICLERHRQIRTSALRARKNTEMQIADLHDRLDSLLVVHEAARLRGASTQNVGALRSFIDGLFSDEETSITLSSIHKAKGLEARKVGVLRYDLLPHPMAKQEWERQQELHLEYVLVTRAMEELYISSSPARENH